MMKWMDFASSVLTLSRKLVFSFEIDSKWAESAELFVNPKLSSGFSSNDFWENSNKQGVGYFFDKSLASVYFCVDVVKAHDSV